MGTKFVLISRALVFSESRLLLHFLLVNVTCTACREGAPSTAGFLHFYTQVSKWIHKHSFTKIPSNAVEQTPPCLRELSVYIEVKIRNAAWKGRNKNTFNHVMPESSGGIPTLQLNWSQKLNVFFKRFHFWDQTTKSY